MVCAVALIGSGNIKRVHQMMQCMVRIFTEIGRFSWYGYQDEKSGVGAIM